MAVSDVIRGEEWLSSAPIHVLLYQAFGWSAPNFYHLPVLRNPDKSKLSKRKGNTSVEWYRSQGILPQALLNYLGMMGFSMPDGRELFSLEEMIAEFSWERVSLGGPVFDYQKLKWLNGKYIREVLDLPELSALVRPWLAARGFDPEEEYLRQVLELMRTRFETLAEFVEKTPYFFTEDYPTGEKAAATLSEGQEILRAVLPKLAGLSEFSHAATEPVIRGLAESLGLKPAKVMQPLRAALTGTLESPGMFELLEVLGKERVLSRLERAMAGVAR
jgi:glutamyl-tRNA synthetase